LQSIVLIGNAEDHKKVNVVGDPDSIEAGELLGELKKDSEISNSAAKMDLKGKKFQI
jgi:hypothetical protein